MTSAGSARVAYEKEDSYNTLPGSPTWVQPFENVTVSEASLSNALQRARQPDDPRPDAAREGNVEGAFSISGALTDTNFHDIVFPESSSTSLATGAALAPTATWYLESGLPGGTDQERFLSGAAVESVAWNYNQGEDVTVDLTIIYGDEPEVGGSHGSAPSTINQPSKADIVRWHGTSFDINSTAVSKLQSLTLEISGMARFRRGQQRKPVDAVVGAYEPTLSVQAILENNDQYQLALGGSAATSIQDSIDTSSATLAFDKEDGTTIVTYNLSDLQPNRYNWQDLVSPDTDITEPVDYFLDDVAVA
jgi:hypothetical protein